MEVYYYGSFLNIYIYKKSLIFAPYSGAKIPSTRRHMLAKKKKYQYQEWFVSYGVADHGVPQTPKHYRLLASLLVIVQNVIVRPYC